MSSKANTLTAHQLSSRATGALIFATFGAIWISLSLSSLHRLTPFTGTAVGVGLFGLVLSCLWIYRRSSSLTQGTSDSVPDPIESARVDRLFNWINLLQWVAIFAAVVLLNVLHIPAFIITAITVIVGLHLLPLARIFRYTPHYVSGAAMVVWAACAAALLTPANVSSITGLGTGLILWTSATHTLLLAMRRVMELAENGASRNDSSNASPNLVSRNGSGRPTIASTHFAA